MDIQQILERIEAHQAQLDLLRPIPAEQEQMVWQKLELAWNFHSNALDGNSLTLGEVRAFLEHGLTAGGKPFRDYLEMRGHDEAISYVWELVRQQPRLLASGQETTPGQRPLPPITEAILQKLHRLLLVEAYDLPTMDVSGLPLMKRVQPGQYKRLPNHAATIGGHTHFYPAPEAVPGLMAELLDWVSQQNHLHPLLVAVSFHYRLLAISPFDDGNGRLARLMLNYILMSQGYPPLIIRKEQQADYALAIAQADEDDDLEPLLVLAGKALLESQELYQRGARGEALEELSSLDKKLALLHKKFLAKEEKARLLAENRIAQRQRFVAEFLRPFLEQLYSQMVKFDHLFEEATFHLRGYRAGKNSFGAFIEPVNELLQKHPQATAVTLHFQYHATRHIGKKLLFVEFDVDVHLGENRWRIKHSPFAAPNLDSIHGTYDQFDVQAISSLVTIIAEQLYNHVNDKIH